MTLSSAAIPLRSSNSVQHFRCRRLVETVAKHLIYKHFYGLDESVRSAERIFPCPQGMAVGSGPPVLDRATIGLGGGDGDGLTGGDLVECRDEIVLGGLDVGKAGRR